MTPAWCASAASIRPAPADFSAAPTPPAASPTSSIPGTGPSSSGYARCLLRERPQAARLLLQLGCRPSLRPEPQGRRNLHPVLSAARHDDRTTGWGARRSRRPIRRRPSRSTLTNRFGIRGNGVWSFSPTLSPDGWARAAYSSKDIEAGPDGLKPVAPGALAEVVYKVQAANAITSQTIHAQFIADRRGGHGDHLGEPQSRHHLDDGCGD